MASTENPERLPDQTIDSNDNRKDNPVPDVSTVLLRALIKKLEDKQDNNGRDF